LEAEKKAAHPPAGTAGGRRGSVRKKVQTVSSLFQQQLQTLMHSIDETDTHFIRCIKPTPKNAPGLFDGEYVNGQLRSSGVLQNVEVSRAGFPVRMNKRDFELDFRVLDSKHDGGAVGRDITALLQDFDDRFALTIEGVRPWAVGKNLVMFQQDAYDKLQAARIALRNASATKIQARFRGKLTRMRKAKGELFDD
jgi:myosin heavy subunit